MAPRSTVKTQSRILEFLEPEEVIVTRKHFGTHFTNYSKLYNYFFFSFTRSSTETVCLTEEDTGLPV